MQGSPFWIAPEVLQSKGATTKSDVYSYGIILHFFITGQKNPFPERDSSDVVGFFTSVLAGTRPTLPSKKSQVPLFFPSPPFLLHLS